MSDQDQINDRVADIDAAIARLTEERRKLLPLTPEQEQRIIERETI